jgi:deoxyribonuclease V
MKVPRMYAWNPTPIKAVVILRELIKARSNPLFIAPGHRIDVAGAVQAVFAGLREYRLPEPTRLAHFFVNE